MVIKLNAVLSVSAAHRFKKFSLVKQTKVSAQQMAAQTTSSKMTTIQPSTPQLHHQGQSQLGPIRPDQRLLLRRTSLVILPSIFSSLDILDTTSICI